MESDTAGEPMTGLHWNRRSTRAFSHALHAVGWAVAPRSLGYALRRNRKAIAPATHPPRDEQFEHIAALRAVRIPAGRPAVSLDSNEKELIGRFLNHGVARTEEPVEVFDHDFPSWATGKAVPYGIYDLQANTGWVGLGQSSDTPWFAVDSLAAWWAAEGRLRYPEATELLVLADSGGSNGYRPRAWKYYLQHTLRNRYGLTVTVAR